MSDHLNQGKMRLTTDWSNIALLICTEAFGNDFYEAFAGMLAGKTSVTGPIIDVYREHHLPYKRLVERIASTDALIDQIVYRLYGLTEEEIAVVAG